MRQIPGRLLVLILFTILVACQSPTADPTEVPVSTATTAATETPLPTETAVPTATDAPTAAPTNTPLPTDTPVPTDTPAPTSLSYLAGYGGPQHVQWINSDLESYLAAQVGLVIDMTGSNYYSTPIPAVYYTRLAREDNRPDVGSGFIVGHLREFVASGDIADISHLWAANGWDEQFPGALKELATIDGKQYFVPQAIQWNPMFYRTDILAANSVTPPETWDELLTACETLADAGLVPIAVSNVGWTPPAARFFSIINLRVNGAEFHEALMAGQISYEDPRVRTVMELWVEMFEHRCFDTESNAYGEAANMLLNGDAAMYFLGEWLSESYTGGFPDTIDFFSFPLIDPDIERAEIALIYGAYLVSDTTLMAEAEAFLTYLGNVESQSSNVEGVGRLVSNNEVDISALGEMYSRGYDLTVNAAHLTQLFEFNTHPDVAEVGISVFANFFRNQDDIDGSLSRLEDARQKAYGDAVE